MRRFDGVNAQVLGISVDSVPSLKAWAESLGGISYPLLSDFYPHGYVARLYGVLRPEGTSERAIFVIDRQCTIRYVDVHPIDDQPDNEVLFQVLAEIEGTAYTAAVRQAEPVQVQSRAKAVAGATAQAEVVMYCTDWCPACKRARAFLEMHGIPYREINISRDREAAARLRHWTQGYETTPTFEINGEVVINFDRQRLITLLGIQE